MNRVRRMIAVSLDLLADIMLFAMAVILATARRVDPDRAMANGGSLIDE